MIFGSAAKNIVSFNSVSTNSDLPVKSLFAEEIAEVPVSSVNEKESSDFAGTAQLIQE